MCNGTSAHRLVKLLSRSSEQSFMKFCTGRYCRAVSSFTSDSFRNHFGCPVCVSAFILSLIWDNSVAKKSVSNRICGREWDELFPSSVLSMALLLPFHFEVRIFPNYGRSHTSFAQHKSREKHLRSTHTHTHVCIYIYIYIYICVCVCVCVYRTPKKLNFREKQTFFNSLPFTGI